VVVDPNVGIGTGFGRVPFAELHAMFVGEVFVPDFLDAATVFAAVFIATLVHSILPTLE
jgi:Mg/Co/Ni transporter MgtE